jgi:hypothetical protein
MPDDGRTAGNEGGAAAERGDMADITEVGRQALRRRQCAASSNLKETGALDDAPAAFAC